MHTKLLGLLLAALLVFGFAGQAMASFSAGNMIRTIYDAGTADTEVGSNLGVTLGTSFAADNLVGDVIAKSTFTSGTMRVSYFGYSGNWSTGNDKYWVIGPASGTYTMTGGKGIALSSAFNLADAVGLTPYYNNTYGNVTPLGGDSVVASKAWMDSYYSLFEGNGTAVGTFGSTVSPVGSASISLAALATYGYADTALWYFDYNNSAADVNGVQVAILRTFLANADGTANYASGEYIATEIQVVPIPGAVWLLGSGLLGLIGIRRRSA